MTAAHTVLDINDDLPIRTAHPVHSGKVRYVYWLTAADSERLIRSHGYPVRPDAPLAVMVISDRLSAFDCVWHAEGGLHGVPGKGAALNSIASHWFTLFREQGLADSHILDIPHPFVWIVQKARPVMIEAICRQYITGSMWRDYAKGGREFCGIQIPDGLQKDQKLPELLITPSTKGILKGIPGVPEADDVNITRADIEANFAAFNFDSKDDIEHYERLLKEGFEVISNALAELDQIFVDTKFEFGYVTDASGNNKLIYMDEVGTPDSSRIWDGPSYRAGQVVEKSKEEIGRASCRERVADVTGVQTCALPILLKEGFEVISNALAELDQIFVDTKFEFGYVTDASGNNKLIYMDEVGTPDSSRIWDGPSYRAGQVVEKSKEEFRQLLLNYFPDPDILLNKDRMQERQALAKNTALPESVLMQVSETYRRIAETITGEPILLSDNPKQEIIDILRDDYGLID